jgi:RsiW-degrading membrane proteinase PrsW (M82 family)
MILLFISGILSAFFVILVEIGIVSTGMLFGFDITSWEPGVEDSRQWSFLIGIVLLAIAEEVVKFLILRRQLRQIVSTVSLIPSIAFGVGFCIVELGLIFALETPISDPLIPLLGIGTIHLLTSIAYGLTPRTASSFKLATILVVGIASHAFYNIFLSAPLIGWN